ncbi:MAG TPA: hypothetical protein VL359_18660, partial [bacterium]|nr:hypothetical protein [bacterium]
QSRAALEAKLGEPQEVLPQADGGQVLRYRQIRRMVRIRGVPKHPNWTVYDNLCQQDYLVNRQGVVTQAHFQCAL